MEFGYASAIGGPLAPFAADYERWLLERGYRPSSVSDRLSQFDALSRWMASRRCPVSHLTLQHCEQFVAARRHAGHRTWVTATRLELPLEYLRGIGVVGAGRLMGTGPIDELLADYRRYLVLWRGLASCTVDGYLSIARAFMVDRERHRGELDLESLSAVDVTTYVASESRRLSRGGTRGLVAKLRPLLVFLHVQGLVSAPLRWALPAVADLQGHALPRAIKPGVIVMLLSSCDRRRVMGRRDYAILLLLWRLGLRSSEVAAVRLEDIDWRAGELLVHGKGGRLDLLPLPVDVGEGLVAYLQLRPASESREMFMRVTAPIVPLSRGGVSDVVVRACARASVPSIRAHQLRHTAATQMLQAGGSLSEIAQVLRHQQLKTTAVYARVDHAALRALALPWPEGSAA